MPDLVTIANDLKTVPDQWLVQQAQNPSSAAPSFLVLSELQRRQLLRSGASGEQQPKSSVAQDTVANTIKQIAPPAPTGPPPPPGMTPPARSMPGGAMGSPMPGATPPANVPRSMADGGAVDDDDDYLSEMQARPALSIPDLIDRASAQYGLPREIAHAVAKIETPRYTTSAVSPKGAIGAFQLMPGTAQELGVDPRDPEQNVDGGVRYLKQMYDRYGGDRALTLAAYNAGPGAVNRYGGVPPFKETQNYVKKGLKLMNQAPPVSSPVGEASRAMPDISPDAAPPTPTTVPQTAPPVLPNFRGPTPNLSLIPPFTGSTPAPANLGATGLGAALPAATPAEPADLTDARQRLQDLTSGHVAYDPASALSEENIAKNKAAVEAILGKRPDYGTLESAINQLQSQAQQSMQPNIWNMLTSLGFGLLASHSQYFGQALGEAGLGMQAAMEKQRQEGRQNYIEALRAGVDLQSKKNAYDEKVAELNFGQIKEQQQAGITGEKSWQTQVENARKELVKAQTAFDTTIAKSPQAKVQNRLDEINQALPAGQQLTMAQISALPMTDPNRQYVQFGVKPKAGAPSATNDPATQLTNNLAKVNAGRPPDKQVTLQNLNQQTPEIQNFVRYGEKPPGQAQTDARQAAQDARTDARVDRSYQFHQREFDNLDKPIADRLGKVANLTTTLGRGTPQADTLIAPELLSVMAGGAGSGLRMNEAEISRIVGGRSHWETLQAALNQWKLDPTQALQITPEQRKEMWDLVDAVHGKLSAKHNLVQDFQSRMAQSDDPMEHRRLLGLAKRAVSDLDENAFGNSVRYRDKGTVYDIPADQVAGFLTAHPQAKTLGTKHFSEKAGDNYSDFYIPEDLVPDFQKAHPNATGGQ